MQSLPNHIVSSHRLKRMGHCCFIVEKLPLMKRTMQRLALPAKRLKPHRVFNCREQGRQEKAEQTRNKRAELWIWFYSSSPSKLRHVILSLEKRRETCQTGLDAPTIKLLVYTYNIFSYVLVGTKWSTVKETLTRPVQVDMATEDSEWLRMEPWYRQLWTAGSSVAVLMPSAPSVCIVNPSASTWDGWRSRCNSFPKAETW